MTSGATALWNHRGAVFPPLHSYSSRRGSPTIPVRQTETIGLLSIMCRCQPLRSCYCFGGSLLCVFSAVIIACELIWFWQRKCWWDGVDVDLAHEGGSERIVKLWARRVWTLELSLVRLHHVFCSCYLLAFSLLVGLTLFCSFVSALY
jgi:hypothetical protein